MHRHGYKQLNRDSYLSLSPSRPNKPEPPLRINRSGRMLQILVLVFRKKFQSWVFEVRKRVEIWVLGEAEGQRRLSELWERRTDGGVGCGEYGFEKGECIYIYIIFFFLRNGSVSVYIKRIQKVSYCFFFCQEYP